MIKYDEFSLVSQSQCSMSILFMITGPAAQTKIATNYKTTTSQAKKLQESFANETINLSYFIPSIWIPWPSHKKILINDTPWPDSFLSNWAMKGHVADSLHLSRPSKPQLMTSVCLRIMTLLTALITIKPTRHQLWCTDYKNTTIVV